MKLIRNIRRMCCNERQTRCIEFRKSLRAWHIYLYYRIILGYSYVVDTENKIIHDLGSNYTIGCLKELQLRNSKFITLEELARELVKNNNGCYFCFKQFHYPK